MAPSAALFLMAMKVDLPLKIMNMSGDLRHHHVLQILKWLSRGQSTPSKVLSVQNGHNKTQLIALLSQYLIEDNHEVIQSTNDADTEIVTVAIALAKTGRVVTVVVEDTDVLVLLVHHFEATMGNLYMLSSAGSKKGPRLVSIRAVQENIDSLAVKQLLAIYAISGCDTTSVLLNQGKPTIFRKIGGNRLAVPHTDVLSS